VFTVNDYVTITDETNRYYGKTGKIVFIQTDGTYLVDGVRATFYAAVIGAGWPAYHAHQLAPAAAPQKG
jgi:hypothetical protein